MTIDDAAAIALELPDVTEGGRSGNRTWFVAGKSFAWERPLRRADLAALGDALDGPILGARVPDLGVKEALLADDPDVYLTTPHFDGYPAILVRLERIGLAELEELLVEAWLDRAPKRVAAAWLDAQGR
jgi:hypothetical protein